MIFTVMNVEGKSGKARFITVSFQEEPFELQSICAQNAMNGCLLKYEDEKDD